MARILFLEVNREVRCLLQETLEKHGYRVQYQEEAPEPRPVPNVDSDAVFVLCLEDGKTFRPASGWPQQTGSSQPSFITTLLRAFSTWNT